MRARLGAGLLAAGLLASLAAPAYGLETTCLPGEYQGDGLQLAVDDLGALHLARVGRIAGTLHHTTIGPDGAVSDAVIAENISRLGIDEVRDLGLALSPSGVHICAYDAMLRRFDVHHCEGFPCDGPWIRTALDAGPGIGETCALAAFDGGVLAAWHGDGVLRAAWQIDGGPWIPAQIDALAGADVGGQPAIAIGDGVIAIAHLDATNEVLRLSVAEIDGPFAEWRWRTTALDNGGWSPAAFFADGALHAYHGGVPTDPDVESDVAVFSTEGPPLGPYRTGVEPGFDLGGSLDAVYGDGAAWLFVRSRTRSALFGAYDALYLDHGPPGGALERETIAESGPAGLRHTYQGLQVALDPFGLPVLAWFDDAAGGFGQPARAVVCSAREADRDGDAVPDVIEAERGTDPERADTDGDGRSDGEEILIDGTDPGGAAPCVAEACNGRDDDCDERVDEGLDGGECATGAQGACAVGRRVCVDGRAGCVPLSDAGEEQCSGADEDCDGATDEGAVRCGAGRCAAEAPLCIDAQPAQCVPGEPAADDSTCDGIDDDCDGVADEDYRPRPLSCGQGRCRADGQTVCDGGAESDRCDPGQPAASDATCDGIDDDCDGIADEDAAPIPVRCGLGACAADGVAACVAGGRVEDCQPGAPAADDTTCDGVDDDCDGAADEDHPVEPTACGAGACADTGARRCIDGAAVDTCRPGGGAPDDTCDGIDDDCDGATDEGFGAISSCGVGPCRSIADVRCVDGVAVDPCQPRAPLGPDETCDGVDDDCDGATDEAVADRPTTCGVGACAAAGTARCDGGLIIDDCVPGGPPAPDDAECDGVDDDCDGATDEGAACDCPPDEPGCGCLADDVTCDGIDDDCDGAADEGYGARPAVCGVGSCASEGIAICMDGAVVVDCTPLEPDAGAVDADCDGIDDDCDGAIDEGFPAGEIECGVGICAAVGTVRCVGGRIIERCRPGPGRGNDPICNGVDDDCDGTTDEGAWPEPITCGVGACAADGQRACRRGRYVDRCTPGAAAADDATCDGIDDDCDGFADEDATGAPTTCGEGACAARGTANCGAGALLDDCTPGEPAADDAACDGIDDDCDGAVDEDYPDPVVRCGVGACVDEAASACIGGVEVERCAPGEPAADDAACDGVDADCDGAVDEDVATAPTACGRGACSQAGELRCTGGALVDDCTPGEPGPFDAVCDGIDADCDGAVDEDFVGEQRRCGLGACARLGRASCVDGEVLEGPCVPAPAGEELCDGADRDCDGVIDEGCVDERDAGVEPTPDAVVDAAVDATVELDARPIVLPDTGAAPDAGAQSDATPDAPDATLDASDAMPDAMPDAMSGAMSDAMSDASGAMPDASDAMPPARDADRPARDGGIDRPDAVRLDYALDPLDELVPDREFGCFGRIAPGGGGWLMLLLFGGLLGLRRR